MALHWKSKRFNLEQLPEVAAELLLEFNNLLDTSSGKIPSGVVALQGEMGAGKTTLVQALCQAWGFEQQAVRNTYVEAKANKLVEKWFCLRSKVSEHINYSTVLKLFVSGDQFSAHPCADDSAKPSSSRGL